jgi:antimicrobial peptide system SdpA family protein
MRLQQIKSIVFGGSIVLIMLLIVFLLAASVPESTIKVTKASRMQLTRIVPEGWAFFTRDPKGPEFILFEKGADKKLHRFVNRPATLRYLFGINRTARVISQEFGRLLEYLPVSDSLWRDIEGPIDNFASLADSLPITKIPNQSLVPYIKDTFIVQKIEPIPWAWAGSKKIAAYTKSKICKIYVVKSKTLVQK